MADKQNPSSRSSGNKKAPVRRNDVIRCENCGEDYAITYKRCPFCDERPGRAGGIVTGGRRVANTRGGGYGRPVNPIQVAGLIISLIVIIAALVIVFRFLGGPLLSGKGSSSSEGSSVSTSQGSAGQSGSSGTSQSGSQSGAQSGASSGDASSSGQGSTSAGQTGDSSSGTQSGDVEVESITLSRSEYTLPYNESYALTATVTPSGVKEAVVWTSSNPDVLTVDSEGNTQNVNTGSSLERVTVTATCGGMKAECVVYCRAQNAGSGSTESGNSGTSGGSTGTVTSGSKGTIVNAGGGLNIRSGPGTSYDKVASAQNGAEVTILGEENGWYKIKYNNTDTGYVSKDYVSVK